MKTRRTVTTTTINSDEDGFQQPGVWLDQSGVDFLEVEINYHGDTVWVNVDGVTVARFQRIKSLTITDNRRENRDAISDCGG